MEEDWKRAKGPFAVIFSPPALWLFVFFVVPLAIVWAYSFGQNTGPTTIEISGTFRHYVRAADPVYLDIFLKSLGMATITTLLCLVIGFPVALAITFAPYSEETIALAQDARDRGLPVVALTDLLTSPLARVADAVLTVPEVDFGAFRSLSATIAMAITLAVAVGSARG